MKETRSFPKMLTPSTALSVEITIDYQPPIDYEYTSPPYYRPCTPITLNCNAQRASGHVSYTWSSSNPASFVSGATSSSVSQTILTNLDGGSHTCCARDGAGNSGCDRIEIFIKGEGHRYTYTLAVNPYLMFDEKVTLFGI